MWVPFCHLRSIKSVYGFTLWNLLFLFLCQKRHCDSKTACGLTHSGIYCDCVLPLQGLKKLVSGHMITRHEHLVTKINININTCLDSQRCQDFHLSCTEHQSWFNLCNYPAILCVLKTFTLITVCGLNILVKVVILYYYSPPPYQKGVTFAVYFGLFVICDFVRIFLMQLYIWDLITHDS